MIGHRGERHLQLRPLGLFHSSIQSGFSPPHRWSYTPGTGPRRVASSAVVDHHSVDIATSRRSGRRRPSDCSSGWYRCGPTARRRRGQTRRSCRASSRRGCRRTGSHSRAFAQHRIAHVLAWPGSTRTFHCPTSSNTAPWATCQSCSAVVRSGSNNAPRSRPASGGKRNGGVGRPKCGGAQLFDGHAEQFGSDAGCDHPGRLALIVRRADGGIALDVFHRAHARADRPRHVGDRGVALDVDELILLAAGHAPQHQTRPVVRAASTLDTGAESAGGRNEFD